MEKDSVNDFLTCELCNQPYTDPRCLPCLHTFCRNCIEKSFEDRVGKSSPDDYFCPACYVPSSVSNKATVGSLPVNHLIVSLAEANDIKFAYPKCIPCSRNEIDLKAAEWCSTCHETLCEKCSGIHGTLKATMKHNIMGLAKAKKLALKEIIPIPTCSEHDDHILTQYCEDHSQPICDTCAGSLHRKCHYIKPIGVVAQAKEKDSLSTMGVLCEQTKKAKNTLEERQKRLQELETGKKELLGKIRSVRKSMNDILSRHEKQIINELEVLHAHEKTAIEGNIWEAKTVFKATSNSSRILKQAAENGSDAHLLQWLEQVKNSSNRYDEDLQSLRQHLNRTTIQFNVNRQLDDVMKTVNNLGELDLKQSAVHTQHITNGLPPTPTNKDPERVSLKKPRERKNSANSSIKSRHSPIERPLTPRKKLLPEYQFSAHVATDLDQCWLTGVAVLLNDQWIFADRNNKKIKLFGADYKLKSERNLEIAPFDVTVVEKNEIAVSIPDGSKIEIYSIIPGINLLRVLTMDERCYGISFSGSRFAVACSMASQPSIKIISYEGEEKLNICPQNGSAPLFLRPWYVKWGINGKTLYVTDSNRSQVIGITGTVLKNFAYYNDTLKSPRGITVRDDGGFCVCGWGSDNVQIVDSKGKFIHELLGRHDGVIGPQTLCLSNDQQRLVLTLDTTSGTSDTVQVFRV